MTLISLRVTTPDISRLQREVGRVPQGLRRALSMALNRTITGSRTDATRIITGDMFVRARDVRQTMRVGKASRARLSAYLRLRGKGSLPLIDFNVRPRAPGVRRPKVGVAARVLRTSQAARIPGAFIARMRSGHVGVFERTTDSRLPIRELFGPSFIRHLGKDDKAAELQRRADVRLSKEIHGAVRKLTRVGL